MVELLCGIPCLGPHEALPGLQRMRHCWGLTLGSMLGAGVWQWTRSAEPLASEGTQSPGWSTVEPAPKPVTQGYVSTNGGVACKGVFREPGECPYPGLKPVSLSPGKALKAGEEGWEWAHQAGGAVCAEALA